MWIKDQKEKLKLAREIPYLSLCLIPMAQPKQIISKITFKVFYIKGGVFSNLVSYIRKLFTFGWKDEVVQLNKCETDPYFLQNFQCTTMFISMFCKSCEPMLCEPEIVQANHWHQLQNFWTISGSHNMGSQILQNTEIIKQTDVLLWKIWRIYGSVSYLFSCTFCSWKYCQCKLSMVTTYIFVQMWTFSSI